MKLILASFAVIHFLFACIGHVMGEDVHAVRMVYLLAVITGTAAVLLHALDQLRSELREQKTAERQDQ